MDSFWKAFCVKRAGDARRLPPAAPKFVCAECGCKILPYTDMFMLNSRAFCSERCRAIAPESPKSRRVLAALERLAAQEGGSADGALRARLRGVEFVE